jgi:hypothetical protein
MSDDRTQSTPTTPPVAPVSTALPVPAAAPRKSTSGRALNLLLGLAVAVAIGGVAFAIGRGTAPATAARFPGGLGNGANPGASFVPGASGLPGGGQGGPGGLFGGGGLAISGTVESVDGDTLTIKTDDGTTIEVTIGTDTDYHTQAAATVSDVTSGATVSVQLDFTGGPGQGGQGGTDGPVGTASDITVIP